jgi:hypothetical protein|tara:strand:- start:5500 stop:5670 length:171 start_codon:yes stop_codon:yes gene_type:complete
MDKNKVINWLDHQINEEQDILDLAVKTHEIQRSMKYAIRLDLYHEIHEKIKNNEFE